MIRFTYILTLINVFCVYCVRAQASGRKLGMRISLPVSKRADAARRRLGLILRKAFSRRTFTARRWYGRMSGCVRPEQRRILMVISNGAPIDDSVLSVNPGN